MNDNTNIIYLGAVVLIIFAAVLIIHFIALSKAVQDRPNRMPVYCGAVFIVGVGALAVLAHTAQSSDVISGYSPFGPAELSKAGQLLSAPVSGEFGEGSDVDIADMSLAFNDGSFLNISYDAYESGGVQQPFQVTGSGKLYPGKAAQSDAPDGAIPMPVLVSALEQLGQAGWDKVLDLPGKGAVVLDTAGSLSPAQLDGNVYLLRDGALVSAAGLDGAELDGEMPTLSYRAGEQTGYICLGDTL